MPIPFCNNQTQCPLVVFDKHLRNYDSVNLAAWCGAQPATTDQLSLLLRLVIGLSVAAGFAACGIWRFRSLLAGCGQWRDVQTDQRRITWPHAGAPGFGFGIYY